MLTRLSIKSKKAKPQGLLDEYSEEKGWSGGKKEQKLVEL